MYQDEKIFLNTARATARTVAALVRLGVPFKSISVVAGEKSKKGNSDKQSCIYKSLEVGYEWSISEELTP